MTPHREFEPKLVTILREGYSRRQFAHDLAAGGPDPGRGHDPRTDGTAIVMTAVQDQPRAVLERAGIVDRVGEENLVPDFRRAVERARQIVGTPAASER